MNICVNEVNCSIEINTNQHLLSVNDNCKVIELPNGLTIKLNGNIFLTVEKLTQQQKQRIFDDTFDDTFE